MSLLCPYLTSVTAVVQLSRLTGVSVQQSEHIILEFVLVSISTQENELKVPLLNFFLESLIRYTENLCVKLYTLKNYRIFLSKAKMILCFRESLF